MAPSRAVLIAVNLAGALALAGCASSGLAYPSTANIDRITQKTLTPAEQKAAIEDLQGTTAPVSEPTPLIKATTSGVVQ